VNPAGRRRAERRVLVTGAAGMLGSQLLRSAPDGVAAVGTDLAPGAELAAPGVDLADPGAVAALFERFAPLGGVIHAAAWTAVDAAESAEAAALRANAEAPRVLAEACRAARIPLVAVGTDFVFDGRAREPYREEDRPRPLSAYGRTKLAGERAVLETHPEGAAVVRTQWLYGPRGNHFPRTIVKAARERGALRVVDDQVGSPTTTLELAPALWDVLASGATGVFHAACEGSCSWHGFTAAILEELGLEHVELARCTTAEFPRPAARPAYSVLDSTRLALLRGRSLAPWRDALAAYLALEPL
jgi:dTDP-4-dehydrorhamnose reductase